MLLDSLWTCEGGWHVLTVTLTHPPKCLRANAKAPSSKWAKIGRDKAKAKYRAHAKIMALSIVNRRGAPMWERASIRITWYAQRSSWLPDRTNVAQSMKAGIDGLQDAGVIVNDSGLDSPEIVLAVDAARPRVEIRVVGKRAGEGA